ncbi:ribose-5-phosphate isomerase A [Candidatus Vidania fulgoroideorum]
MISSVSYIILLDYIKNNIKKNPIISFGKGNFINYIINKINFKKINFKKIFVTTKEQEKILKKKGIIFNDFNKFKKIDCHISLSDSINENFFIKGFAGFITKEKFYYNNSKKKIIITNNNYFSHYNKIPIEILSSFKKIINEYITNKLNIEINKKFISNYNYITIIKAKIFKKNIIEEEKKIRLIDGVLSSGLYKKDINAFYLFINKSNVYLI